MASEAKDENPEHINLKVMGQDGNIVQFKIKKHTALKKLMATYCERAGLALQVRSFKSLVILMMVHILIFNIHIQM